MQLIWAMLSSLWGLPQELYKRCSRREHFRVVEENISDIGVVEDIISNLCQVLKADVFGGNKACFTAAE